MVVASPAACGPQIDESHWGSIASPAPPTPASSPGQCRSSRDPLLSVARRVRCPGTTAPPGETTTPTDGLLRSATSAGRPTQLLRGDRRVLSEKKNKGRHVSVQERRSRPRTQRSAIPTAVLPGQECARGRHTRAPSGRHPPVRTAAETDASPPGQTSSSSSTADCPDTGTAASSEYRGRQVISLRPTRGSGWMQAPTPRGKDASCATDSLTTCYRITAS